MDLVTPTKLLDAQQEIINLITSEQPLPFTLNRICELIEDMLDTPKGFSSILLKDNNRLKHVAAPSLDRKYCGLIDGLEIGPEVGSCGTAIYTRQRIIVEDIQNDPLWDAYKDIANSFKLRACWSTPIISDSKAVLGSFAIYYQITMRPKQKHIDIIDRFVSLGRLAIEESLKRQERADLITTIQQANERFNAITSVLPDVAFILDSDGKYINVHGKDSNRLYLTREAIIGKTIFEVLPENTANKIFRVIQKTIADKENQTAEYDLDIDGENRIYEGRTSIIKSYQPQNFKKCYVLWMARDITDQKRAEAAVQKLAFYDQLTSLPNRRLVINRIENLIQRIQRSHCVSTLLFLDLDNFKRINDSMGHSEGDKVLIAIKDRLAPILRTSDTFARIGGDEFLILIENSETSAEVAIEEALVVSRKIIDAVKQPLKTVRASYQLSASIGIALIDENTKNKDEVLKQADSAMFSSKQRGGNTYTLYDPKLQAIIDQQIELERDIINALAKNEFCTYFQPQVNVMGEATGAEALIRWNHPTKGLVSPQHFVPVAEQFGLIQRLTQIVMSDVCKMILRLVQSKLIDADFKISANVSAIEFQNPQILTSITQASRQFKVPCNRIKLELTETMLVSDFEATHRQITQLKDLGFKLSIDDFGTGYSSLNYLHLLPIDELKIDKTFVDKMLESNSGSAIISAIISLCLNLNIKVIAEGVETQSQYEALKRQNIDAMQGFFFAKPMPANEFISWLATKQSKAAI